MNIDSDYVNFIDKLSNKRLTYVNRSRLFDDGYF